MHTALITPDRSSVDCVSSIFVSAEAIEPPRVNELDRLQTVSRACNCQSARTCQSSGTPHAGLAAKCTRFDARAVADRLQSRCDRKEFDMAELIVVGFKKDMHRASEALNMLQDMNSSWVVDLNDAVAVYRDYKGKLRVDQSYQMTTGEGAGWGGLLGGLIGAMIAAPFTGGASAAAVLAAGSVSGVALGATFGAVDAESWKDDYGISDDFVQRVGVMIQPGDSAIFALVRTINPNLVADAFQGYGGTILRTTLSDEQRAKVEKTLQGAR
jgi:uncharacterized membrane protein